MTPDEKPRLGDHSEAFQHAGESGMACFAEHDCVRLCRSTAARVIGESRDVILPARSRAVVVLVHGDTLAPEAYELEFHLPGEDCHALATVAASDVAPG